MRTLVSVNIMMCVPSGMYASYCIAYSLLKEFVSIEYGYAFASLSCSVYSCSGLPCFFVFFCGEKISFLVVKSIVVIHLNSAMTNTSTAVMKVEISVL